MTLVILAAGMGSRFGSLKQVTPFGPSGEFIIDYSIYDAKIAGFDKVVFIIKEEHLDIFKESVGKRIEKHIKVEYAFQKLEQLPDGYNVPDNRTKPWGTSQALLCIQEYVDDKFLVINADDFYGRDAFICMADYMKNADDKEYSMAGYLLKNTVSDNGSVNRGLCETENNDLVKVEETLNIVKENDKIGYYSDDFIELSEDTLVSMNFWGFDKSVFNYLNDSFIKFLDKNKDNLEKCEFYIPLLIQELIEDNEVTVKVIPTASKWYGVTYQEDKEEVLLKIKEMIDNGVYPSNLWE